MIGYQLGMIGWIVQMYGEYYVCYYDFGVFFEGKVVSGVVEFVIWFFFLVNQIWLVICEGKIVGLLVIDGEDFGQQEVYLCWFIFDDSCWGIGIGRWFFSEVMVFCDSCQFSVVQLWIFKGLDVVCKLYEFFGFMLI